VVRVPDGLRVGWQERRAPTGVPSGLTGVAQLKEHARPLDQCVQNATTEMLVWLQQRYGYTAAEANLLIGFAVEYEVGNMFDPAYTMICKIPKRLLPG
jgi:acetamidase/formamidase